jgi:hypothetical protein
MEEKEMEKGGESAIILTPMNETSDLQKNFFDKNKKFFCKSLQRQPLHSAKILL